MLGKKRTAHDILQEIVAACLEPIERTALYYTIRTSNTVLGPRLDDALRLKLVENLGNKYRTTQKGVNFLKIWAQVQNFLKEE